MRICILIMMAPVKSTVKVESCPFIENTNVLIDCVWRHSLGNF